MTRTLSIPRVLAGSLFSTLLFAGCASNSQSPADMSSDVEPDLASTMRFDLSGADLGGSDMRTSQATCRGADAPGALLRQATNGILLPNSTHTYALDLDGDGKTENQLRNIMSTLALTGLDLQGSIDADVASGALVYLIGVTTLKIDTSTCTGVTINGAQPRGAGNPPNYDGSDVFTKAAGTQADLAATVTSSVLNSKAPKDIKASDEGRIDLTLNLNGKPLVLPVRGVHIQGTLTSNAGNLFIQNGQINGAVAQQDVQGKVLPAVAQMVTDMIHGDPTGTTANTLIGLFENMSTPVTRTKCMVAADCCHTSPATCKILPEEIQASPLGGVMNPDVQVFDDFGQWAPVPGGKTKNGLSLGISFTTVPATY